ncbi:MAG: leucine-rich repeat domain-containing protein [Sedimentisphaerales bacterium]|nr:leucine-rich repeat domain-containing protein [Sedimentisphaerales bacterium]
MKNEKTLQNQTDEKKPSRRKYIIAACIILCVLAGYVYWVMTYTHVYYESQKQSKIIIRKIAAKQLNKDPNELTDEDFATINELLIEDSEITDIKLLDKFTNLQKLFISTKGQVYVNTIPTWKLILYKLGIIDPAIRIPIDLSPLENLSNLKTLIAVNCQISHIEKLKELKNLQTLWLGSAKVSDFKPLKELINLRILHLENTQISDLKPLEDLTNLQELYLSKTKVSDLEPLKKLTNLQILKLNGTQISDLKPLEDLTNLQQLNLTRTQVSDIGPLKKLINLQILHLEFIQISDIKPLKELTNLQELYLTMTHVSDLESLKELTNLNSLYLRECPNTTDKMVEDLQKALPNLKIER